MLPIRRIIPQISRSVSITRSVSNTALQNDTQAELFSLLPEWKEIGSAIELPPQRDDCSIQELMRAGVHLGHTTAKWHQNMLPYIYGRRAGIHVINLEHTLTHLRRAIAVTQEIARKDGTILFLGMRPFQKDIVSSCARYSNQFYVHGKWLEGCLSNHEQTLKKAARNGQLIQPDLIICLDVNESQVALKEASNVLIPTIGLCDTDSDPLTVTYPIPGNDDSFSSVELIGFLLAKAAMTPK